MITSRGERPALSHGGACRASVNTLLLRVNVAFTSELWKTLTILALWREMSLMQPVERWVWRENLDIRVSGCIIGGIEACRPRRCRRCIKC